MTLPLENLDDKTFDDLVRDALLKIPIYSPGWTDHNKSDPGITFIELLAWIVEMQIYRLNRISDRSYLKFLSLLGIDGPRPAMSARADVTFCFMDGESEKSAAKRAEIPIGTALGTSKGDIIFRTERKLTVLDLELSVIAATKDATIIKNNKEISSAGLRYFFAFGHEATADGALYLGFKRQSSKGLMGEILTLAFYLYNEPFRPDPDENVLEPPVALKWECRTSISIWSEIEIIEDETQSLCYSGKIGLKFAKEPLSSAEAPEEIADLLWKNDADDKSKTLIWIRCTARDPGARYDTPPKIVEILANTVSAIEGALYESKPEEPGKEYEVHNAGLPGMVIALKHAPIREIVCVKDSLVEAEDILRIGSGVNQTSWKQVKDLDSSGPHDRQYLLDQESGIISFGDDIHGAIPPGDEKIQIAYISGRGPQGNVASGAINRIAGGTGLQGDWSSLIVKNKREASGGRPAETLEEAKSRALRALKEITRAVTALDYEALACLTPGIKVARAKAIPQYHPRCKGRIPNAMTVIVVPDSSDPLPMPGKWFLKAVFEHLDRRRLLTTRLFVYPPAYVKVGIEAKIVARRRRDKDAVKKAVCSRLEKFLSPIKGGEDGKGWPFGRPVYLSEIYRIIASTDGVDHVYGVKLSGTVTKGDADLCLANDEGDAEDLRIPEHSLVYYDPSNDDKVIAKAAGDNDSRDKDPGEGSSGGD